MDRFEIRHCNGEKMIKIREMLPSEAPILSAMSDKVNWNNSPAECQLVASADNMKLFFLECDGEIAGSIGMVTYEPQAQVFINLVIVKEEFRRRGFATMMVEHVLDLTRDYKTKRLHATPDGSKVYAKLGFEPRRHISFFACEEPQLVAPAGITVHPMTAAEQQLAVKRDAECFGFSRHNLLNFNYAEFGQFALCADNGKGHIWGRRWKKYRQMAALVSEDLPTAMALAAAATELDKSQPQSIITYDSQKEFQSYLQSGGFRQVREMLDMILGEDVPEPPEIYRSIYGGDQA